MGSKGESGSGKKGKLKKKKLVNVIHEEEENTLVLRYVPDVFLPPPVSGPSGQECPA